jgi:hypothetical protein
MNRKLVAIILIVLGIVVLAYSGISFSTRGKPIDIGSVHIETTRRHFIPPVAGAIALVSGLALFVAGNKKE